MNRLKPSLRVDNLEARANMSVSVAAISGSLVVNGDAASDQIQLIRLNNGMTRVQGLNGTKVNGAAFADRFLTQNLAINMGNGNNVVSLSDANGGVVARDITIYTGSGVDSVGTNKLYAVDDILIDTGEGVDYVYLNNVTATNSDNPPNNIGEDGISVYTRGGGDTVSIYSSYSAEDITVILDTPTSGTAGSADTLFMTSVRAVDDFFIYGFGGDDRMYLDRLTANDVLSVSLGAGNDFLKLTNSTARTATTIGEAGYDTLQYYNNSFIPWTITGFERYVNGQ